MASYEGLEIIPFDILEQGSQKIVRYILDLFISPEADPLFRSKLMVVGHENVGKTTLVDCLFPLLGYLKTQGTAVKTRYWCRLQGGLFTKYKTPQDTVPHKGRFIYFDNRKWTVNERASDSTYEIIVSSNDKGAQGDKEIKIYCEDPSGFTRWVTRLKRACMNDATHGIEIQRQTVNSTASGSSSSVVLQGETSPF